MRSLRTTHQNSTETGAYSFHYFDQNAIAKTRDADLITQMLEILKNKGVNMSFLAVDEIIKMNDLALAKTVQAHLLKMKQGSHLNLNEFIAKSTS